MLEPLLAGVAPGEPFQFEREGYFTLDSVLSRPDHLIFNRTIGLRDSWARRQAG